MAKLIDLTGQVFGKLTVIERDTTKTNGTYWKCKCDCGNSVSLRKDVLTRANKPQRSCGCDLAQRNSDAHLKDETGNKYGKLTVIKRVDNSPGRKEARWLCQCECGNTTEVSGTHLRNGSVQSCGCKLYESKNGIDETGNRYGMLTVLERSYDKNDGTHIFWKCQCDCGNIVTINGTYLRAGISTNCGCKRSVGETKIAQLLTEANIHFQREYTFKDLVGINKGYLRFDFGILDNNDNLLYLIEYDGVQHTDKSCFGQREEQFAMLQQHDTLKNNYCKEHNIPLIRIPYTKLKELSLSDLML